MADALEAPRSIADLYLARGSEVSACRPIMTGDVFSNVLVPGVEETEGDEDQLAMVVSHPCSMRNGYILKPKIQVIRIVRAPVLDLSAWRMHFDRLPLPNLLGKSGDDDLLDPEDSYAAIFELRGRVATSDLSVDHRKACLSEEGVGFLHQRMGHADNRFAASVGDLVAACASPFAETELAEEWNTTLVAVTTLTVTERDERLLEAAQEFEQVLSELRETSNGPGKKVSKYRLRDDLGIPKKLPAARREIRRIIKQRSVE